MIILEQKVTSTNLTYRDTSQKTIESLFLEADVVSFFIALTRKDELSRAGTKGALTGAGACLITGAIIGFGLGSSSPGIGPSGLEGVVGCGLSSAFPGAVLGALSGRAK